MRARPRALTIVLAVLVAAAAALLGACGGGGGGDTQNARQVVKQTFNGKKTVDSGKLNLALTAKLRGTGLAASQVKEPIVIKMSGPFQSRGENALPAMDLELSATGAGQDFSAGAISTGDRGYISFQGKDYVVPARVFRQFKQGFEQQQRQDKGSGQLDLKALGIDPETWLRNPKNEGDADVGGTKTTHVSGDVDVDALLNDFNDLLKRTDKLNLSQQQQQQLPTSIKPSDRKQIKQSIKNARVDIWTGKDDKTLRRLQVKLDFDVPPSLQTQAQGLTGGNVNLTVEVADVNKKQDIKAPANPRSWKELQQQVGLSALAGGGIGGTGGGTSGSGSGSSGGSSNGLGSGSSGSGTSGSGSARTQKYLKCVQKAKTPEDVQACGAALGR